MQPWSIADLFQGSWVYTLLMAGTALLVIAYIVMSVRDWWQSR